MDIKTKMALFPYFAYLFSKDANPEKYGAVGTAEEWSKLIQEDEETANAAVAAAEQLTDEEWQNIEEQYSRVNTETEAIMAAKGAKLEKLNALKAKVPTDKKGGTMPKKKKCSCGCDLILGRSAGGKIIETCACKCGGKMKKKK